MSGLAGYYCGMALIDSTGFAHVRLTVTDAAGAADSVLVRLQ